MVLSVILLVLGSTSTWVLGSRFWVQAVWYNLFSVVFFVLGLSLLILTLPLLGLASKSTTLSPGLCVGRPRQYDTICWKLDLLSGFFMFSWMILWADEVNKMWLVSCERQGNLTQWPTSDPKCKLGGGVMGRLGGSSFMLGFGWGIRGWVS